MSHVNHMSQPANGRVSTGNNSVNGRKEIIDVTRRQYLQEFDMFVVNNLLMTVVIFEDYDGDMKIFQSKDSPREKEIAQLNAEFEERHNKSLIYPDTLFENVNKNISFQRRCEEHGTSLIPQRIYVVDNLVEVTEKVEEASDYVDPNNNDEDNDYTSQSIKVDSVHSARTGYVKLENRVYRKSTVSSVFSRPSSEPRSSSSDSSVSYGVIDSMRTKEPLGDLDDDLRSTNRVLFVAVRNGNFIRRPSSNYSDDRSSLNLRRHDEFMSSQHYAAKFRVDFHKSIGSDLGFDLKGHYYGQKPESMLETFYCRYVDRNGHCSNYEITSAIDIDWPVKITTNWFRRTRAEMVDPNTNSLLKWPADTMRKIAMVEKCVILPRYAIQKRHRTKEEDIEWEIAFPRAEKYLQSTLSHAQTKTYLMLVLLHRSFIEPITQHTGLLLEHIKMVFYWELERSYVSFPETRMGNKLIDILQRLYKDILAVRHLDHYFYGQVKNVFASIPNSHIAVAQSKVNDILNNKVSYFIAALCNLRYNTPDYFPKFNYAELHQILTQEALVLKPNGLRPKGTASKAICHMPCEWIDVQKSCKVGSEEAIRKIKTLKMFIEHFIKIGQVSFLRSRKQLGRAYYMQARDLTTILEEQGNHEDDVKKFKVSIQIGCPDL